MNQISQLLNKKVLDIMFRALDDVQIDVLILILDSFARLLIISKSRLIIEGKCSIFLMLYNLKLNETCEEFTFHKNMKVSNSAMKICDLFSECLNAFEENNKH